MDTNPIEYLFFQNLYQNGMGFYFWLFFLHAKKTCPFMKREDKTAIFKMSILFCFIFKIKERRFAKMLESKFKTKLIKELERMFPGCLIAHTDPNEIQGFPDLIILCEKKWASLEGKKDASAKKQPNQDYYVGRMNEMSFSRFICPENKEEVLYALQQSFES